MSPLLSPGAMAAIQAVGRLGMIDDVSIYRLQVDEGLDLTDGAYGSSTAFPATPSSVVKGWLVGRWAYARNEDFGEVNTSSTYRLRLPVGTDIDAGDKVEIKGNPYSVMDAGTDQTWPEWLTCTVRRRK